MTFCITPKIWYIMLNDDELSGLVWWCHHPVQLKAVLNKQWLSISNTDFRKFFSIKLYGKNQIHWFWLSKFQLITHPIDFAQFKSGQEIDSTLSKLEFRFPIHLKPFFVGENFLRPSLIIFTPSQSNIT